LPFQQAVRALGEYLEYVVSCQSHSIEYLIDEVDRHLLVKEIAHAVDKNPSGGLPTQWKPKSFWMESYFRETLLPETLGQAFRIAKLAAGGDLGTTGYGIPCSVGPFNGR